MKKGITISTLAITVVLMLIVISVTAVAGSSSIINAQYEENISKIRRVSDAVWAYVSQENALPTTGDIISEDALSNTLKDVIIHASDSNNKLFVVDMSKLSIESSIGNGGTLTDDIFIVAENTNNVYYVKGFEYKSKMIYSHVAINT